MTFEFQLLVAPGKSGEVIIVTPRVIMWSCHNYPSYQRSKLPRGSRTGRAGLININVAPDYFYVDILKCAHLYLIQFHSIERLIPLTLFTNLNPNPPTSSALIKF